MPEVDSQPLIELTKIFQLDKILYLAFALFCLILIVRFTKKFGSRIQERFPRYRLAILQTTTVITFLIYLVGGSSLFYVILDPPRELLLALGGSIAVAVGFSLKDLVGSFVAGLVLLFDRPFQVGDRVQFGDVYGEIEAIGLRAVRLKTLDDSLVTIPNSKFFTDVVSSANAGDLDMMVMVDFHLALDTNLTLAEELLYNIVVTSRFVFLKKPVKIVMSEVEYAHRLAVRMRVKAYVFDVKYEKDFQTDIVARASKTFSERGIARPI